jgi:Tfp pilus assembly protein PilO
MKLTPTIFLILSLGLFFVLITPLKNDIKIQEVEIQALQKDNDTALEYQVKKKELREKYKDSVSPEQEERLRLFLPDSVDNIRLLIDLEALAARKNLEISNIAFNSGGEATGAETQDEGLYEKIVLSFSFVSTYEDFKDFLITLEQSLRLIDVTDIKIQTSADPEISTYQFIINTYWLKR